nr:MAG TPA: hypothetical protein [Caudoviricetes sp.]
MPFFACEKSTESTDENFTHGTIGKCPAQKSAI